MSRASLIASGLSLLLVLPAVAQSLSGLRSSGSSSRPASGSTYRYSSSMGGSNPYSRSGGFYNQNPTGINYPQFGQPQRIGNGFYAIPSGNVNLPMWQAPSGYFYPWAPRPSGFVYSYPMPILYPQQSVPSPALPPLSTVFSDMIKYLNKAKEEKKISERDFVNLKRRVKDLQSKSRHLRIAGGGELDAADEAQLRRDIDQVGKDLAWRTSR